MVAGVGLPEGFVGVHQIPLGESAIAGYTLRTGEPTVVEDLATDDALRGLAGRCCSSAWSAASPSRSTAMTTRSGCWTSTRREPRAFPEDEVAFLTAIGTLVAVAVERHRREQLTKHAALHEPLTGLPNRTLALDRLGRALARRHRDHIDVAIFVLDLDRFKMINDSFGHAAGDDVLLALAPRLTDAVRATDTVAGWAATSSSSSAPTSKARAAPSRSPSGSPPRPRRPLVLDSGEHFLSVSTGIALATTRDDTPESLLGDADAAMYRAKERGRGRYELFDEAMRTSAMARVRTETELRHALDRGELAVWYQPVVDLASGRPVSTEALVRWHHPERGLVGPLDFIPVAEEAGLISELGLYVLEQACQPDRGVAGAARSGDRRVGQRLRAPGDQPRASPRRWRPSPRPAGCAPARSRSRSPRRC